MDRYFKGTDEKGKRALFILYDKPQSNFLGLFDDRNDVHYVDATNIECSGIKHYKDMETAIRSGCWIFREISETEYAMLKYIQTMITEIWMNQFTGGFPRIDTINLNNRLFNQKMRTYEKEMTGQVELPYLYKHCEYNDLSEIIHNEMKQAEQTS